jgi:large subunit ribosomal protein L13
MKTFVPPVMTSIERKWYLIDASSQTLGKMATKIANLLRGKEKPTFTPHLDLGDYVIIVNADKMVLTGNKLEDKMYYTHSGYIGHLKSTKAKDMSSEDIISLAVKGMIPGNKLRKDMLLRLRVFKDENHGHEAQQPQQIEI